MAVRFFTLLCGGLFIKVSPTFITKYKGRGGGVL